MGSSPNKIYTDGHSDLDTTLLESKLCIAYLAVPFPQHSVGIGSLGMVFILFSASFLSSLFSAIFSEFLFVIVAWDGYDTKVFGRIHFVILGLSALSFLFLQ